MPLGLSPKAAIPPVYRLKIHEVEGEGLASRRLQRSSCHQFGLGNRMGRLLDRRGTPGATHVAPASRPAVTRTSPSAFPGIALVAPLDGRLDVFPHLVRRFHAGK